MDDYIPHDDPRRADNLKDFHGKTPEEIKETRWFHGTKNNFNSFKTGPLGTHQRSRAIFVTPDPNFASEFSTKNMVTEWDPVNKIHMPHEMTWDKNPNVMPVHIRAEKPFDYENIMHIHDVLSNIRYANLSDEDAHAITNLIDKGSWEIIESEPVQEAIKKLGYDSFFIKENGVKNLGVYDPAQIKSATGNQGTFDPSNPDITKADGGALTDDEGITAYHGSPHDFEQFDTSKIGTGEGAQSYGHGLYFAGNEDVAKEYRDSLSTNNPEPIEVDGERFHQPTRMQRLVANHFGDVDAVLKEMEPNWEYAIDKHLSLPDDADELERMVAEDNAIEAHRERFAVEGMRGKTVKYGKPGHMYEVHIDAHPDHFLDWDAPLSQQSEHVQKRLNPHHSILSQAAMDMFDGKPEDLSGSDLYQWLSGEHEGGLGSPKHVTEQLSNLGIKGIKYLDAGSRGQTDKPTRNYVVFDHNHVAVKRKYAQGGMVDEAA